MSRAATTDEVIRHREMLIGLSYRLLGSIADAEDAVQETYVRWYRLSEEERAEIVSPRAWLIKTAGRIGLDMLGTARARRERYVGEWLPEPLPTPGRWTSGQGNEPKDPVDQVSMDESVSMALMVVLEAMTPPERVAFILHDVFGYPYRDIAEIVGRSPDACRQLASSARRRLRQARHEPVAPTQHAAAVRSFKRAWETGDLEDLIGLLDPEVTAITDGGGQVSASIEPLHGAEVVARFFLGVHQRQSDLAISEVSVNGEPGLLASGGGQVLAVITLAQTDDRIEHIWAVRNPEKLRLWEGP